MGQLAVIFASISIAFVAFIIFAMVGVAYRTRDSEVHSPTFQEPEQSE